MNSKPFVFESSQKRILLIGMGIGLVSLIVQFLTGDQFRSEFWSSLVQNTAFFTTVTFTSTFFLAANITGYAGWITTFRRIWEHLGTFLSWLLIPIALLVIAVWAGFHELYHWNVHGVADLGDPNYDKIIAGKSGFLNKFWYSIASLGFVAIWYLIAKKLKDSSIAMDNASGVDVPGYKRTRKWAALFLPVAGFLSPFFFWLLVMSIDPHWYSTMFAWYAMVSGWLGSISLTIMVIIYLKSLGYMENVTREHLHDLGKFLFGISIFWTYLWFDQFMLIWYANNGEETVYFFERMRYYPVLYFGNLILNFITPFFILMRNDTKRKFGTLFFAAMIVFVGHWWDYFQMVKPGTRIAAFHAAHHGSTEGHGAETIHMDDAHAATNDHHEDTHATNEDHGTHHAEEAHGEGHANEAHGDAHGEEMAVADDGHPVGFKLGYTIPGFSDFGILIGFLSMLLYFLFGKLATAPLVCSSDPFYEEALHHATGAHIDAELAEGGGHGHH